MKNYCDNCGNPNENNYGNYCVACGTPLSLKKSSINNKNNKKIPKWVVILICIFVFLFLVGIFSNEDKEKNNGSNFNDIDRKRATEKINDNLSSIYDSKLKTNFKIACSQIKMDVSKIKDLQRKDNWNSGPRYTFTYENQTFILYALDNGDVSSITIANSLLDKIYLDGYEPVDVNNFLIDLSTKTNLEVKIEEKIKDYLKYPSTSDFNWIESSYARRYDIYQIKGTFKAKNSFGTEVKNDFVIEFKKSNEAFNVVYLNVNSKKYIGSGSQLKEISRKELKVQEQKNEDNDIILKDGILGTYGKKDKFDGEDYIRYYIPAGTYRAMALTRNAHFFVETIKLHKENGWDTATTIENIKLEMIGETSEFKITKDQCISLVAYTQIKLVKLK